MNKTKLICKLNSHPAIQILKEADFLSNNSPYLTGGAVIDILENRNPKDFDILGFYSSDVTRLVNNGFEYKYETRYSTTFTKCGYLFQLLKTDIERFDFTISQSKFHFKKDGLIIDEIAFTSKLLIPTSFTDKKVVLEALYRKPHWEAKGYTMLHRTYISLVRALTNGLNKES